MLFTARARLETWAHASRVQSDEVTYGLRMEPAALVTGDSGGADGDGAGRAGLDVVEHAARDRGMEVSNTPLTDAQLVRVYGKTGEVCGASPMCGHPTYVPSEFARALEREIIALRKVAQAFKDLYNNAEEWECDGLGLWAQHGWWEAVNDAMEALAPNAKLSGLGREGVR